MGTLFYLLGIGTAGFAGFSGLYFYFIFISSGLMLIGYFFERAGQIMNIINADGGIALFKVIITNLIVYSFLTAPVYFISGLFS